MSRTAYASRGKNRPAKAAIYRVAVGLPVSANCFSRSSCMRSTFSTGRRDLLESAIDEATDAVRELKAGVVGAACQLPSQGSSDTRRLQRSERS